jgi:hypothetical protein
LAFRAHFCRISSSKIERDFMSQTMSQTNRGLAFRVLPLILIASVVPQSLLAAAGAEEFQYPELVMAPRNSDRMISEAKAESDSRFLTHIPMQISALTTLTAGIMHLATSDPDPTSYKPSIGFAGVSVGGAWLLATVGMSVFYTPYQSGADDIKKMPAGSMRDQLSRERMAEERLNGPSSLAYKLIWLSAISNLGAGVTMAVFSQPGSVSLIANAVAAGLSITPLIFPYRWIRVAREQRDYRKRIYGPVADWSVDPLFQFFSADSSMGTGAQLTLRF